MIVSQSRTTPAPACFSLITVKLAELACIFGVAAGIYPTDTPAHAAFKGQAVKP